MKAAKEPVATPGNVKEYIFISKNHISLVVSQVPNLDCKKKSRLSSKVIITTPIPRTCQAVDYILPDHRPCPPVLPMNQYPGFHVPTARHTRFPLQRIHKYSRMIPLD